MMNIFRIRGSQVDQKSSLCSPPLRSPHRHNYTASHSTPLWPVCKCCHLLSVNQNVPTAGAQQFTLSRPAGPTQFSMKSALQTAATTFGVQFSVLNVYSLTAAARKRQARHLSLQVNMTAVCANNCFCSKASWFAVNFWLMAGQVLWSSRYKTLKKWS